MVLERCSHYGGGFVVREREIWCQEQAKVLKKQKGPRSPDLDVPPFLKERGKRPA